jgi:hypothetical protein
VTKVDHPPLNYTEALGMIAAADALNAGLLEIMEPLMDVEDDDPRAQVLSDLARLVAAYEEVRWFPGRLT